MSCAGTDFAEEERIRGFGLGRLGCWFGLGEAVVVGCCAGCCYWVCWDRPKNGKGIKIRILDNNLCNFI